MHSVIWGSKGADGVMWSWSIGNAEPGLDSQSRKEIRRSRRLGGIEETAMMLFWRLELKNCKNRAHWLFRTSSSDGQREHRQAQEVLLLHFNLLGPVRPLRCEFSHHPTIGSDLWPFPTKDFCLICCSVHHPADFESYTLYVAEAEPVDVFHKAVKRPHPPAAHPAPRPQRGQPERLPGQTSKIKPHNNNSLMIIIGIYVLFIGHSRWFTKITINNSHTHKTIKNGLLKRAQNIL